MAGKEPKRYGQLPASEKDAVHAEVASTLLVRLQSSPAAMPLKFSKPDIASALKANQTRFVHEDAYWLAMVDSFFIPWLRDKAAAELEPLRASLSFPLPAPPRKRGYPTCYQGSGADFMADIGAAGVDPDLWDICAGYGSD
jgi:hypothetical protein